MTHPQREDVKGSVWMAVVSLGLFFVPVIGGLVGGLIGGYKIRRMSHALLAALAAGVVAGLGSWLLLSLALPHVLGVTTGVAVFAWILVSEAGLFSGAAIGAISHPVEHAAPA
jgi:hypothetical protein